ncbi:hypothetical protein [Streptomyces purpureus]|uniref:Uncharacterized protein n=1 Tax=Streptomyces purpureus TaxID=1951 RepID=A0A918GYU4_9ACTN|nr:hypothetical protein [Streptomyces purpureus]GGT17017.1 hypothetical protein GCM10014713_07470 [Streptomyces purpureus]
MQPAHAVGFGVVTFGLALMAAGVVWKGRAVRPLSAARARSTLGRRYPRDLLRSADMAIASARGAASQGEPAIVTIDAVVDIARDHFGRTHVPRRDAAAALRLRYEYADCVADCVTDAYDSERRAGVEGEL